ncbi:pectate lyase a [Grosmannia clavigera kw1407]|uniref:pectate lyase n=1 Tax=Grosmannia clavigera (strain kw1407 / UAMH 11150) TaxID=655863 RepID=F0XB73_GROCL|nr:pectate lyase a [Grosmannia clavigera kw1407]EFX05003.1 pectate lyase a [Grosmannia clavigera kw1407]
MHIFTASLLAMLASVAVAVPTRTLQGDSAVHRRTVQKRASITDACDIGYATENGGTTGGSGGTTTTVSTLAQLTAAASSKDSMVIVVSGAITGADKVRVASNKTIIGASGSSMTGVGLFISKASNVIVRNMKISKVLAANGDAIGIQASNNVWVDHCDVSSDRDHDKDFYDGLMDVTHASDYITISNTHLHDHFKASLVGHSDNNGAQDTGHLIVTFANNYWTNVNSRGPSVRFGTGHIFNSYYSNVNDGINTRMGAQLLIESSVFENASSEVIYSAYSHSAGFAVVKDVDLGGSKNTAATGTLTSVPYSYKLLGSANVKSSVMANAGQTLKF